MAAASASTTTWAYTCVAHYSPAGNINGSYPANVKQYNATAYSIYTASLNSGVSTTTTTTTTTKAATVAAQALPTGCLDAFRQAVLNRTNILRGSHNSRFLTQSTTLNSAALLNSQKLMAGQYVALPTTTTELRYRKSFFTTAIGSTNDCISN